ncbi:MAG: phosphotransferase [Bacteroidaceae bacterium]|nr:phosphotransferase [Bacteroidaceae bacterium]
MMNDELRELYVAYAGGEPKSVLRLTAAGSNRVYYRISYPDGRTTVGVEGTNADENAAFLEIGRHLRGAGLPVPEILAVSDTGMCYLIEDLGDVSLFGMLESAREDGIYGSGQVEMLEKVMRLLPDIQFKGGHGMDYSVCFPCASFDRRSIFWDLNYFKYSFLKASGLEFHEACLEDDFGNLASVLLADAPYDTFMYRDFQARNVMVRDGEPWFIDFQGGRRGPVEYDVASFLWQARAAYPRELREHLVNEYLESLGRYRNVDGGTFRKGLMHFVLFRTLQVLGAYGFRGYFERKQHFLQSIPAAMNNLKELLEQGVGEQEYPYLYKLLIGLAGLPQFAPIRQPADGLLTVRVMSFSYRKGIPEDCSGNGGGFVFDCRAMENPGRYEQYKGITGADAPVIEFLEAHGEVQGFLEHVYGLVDPAVRNYVERGFRNLMVAFGCTGGQHRSLYCANHLAGHLKEKYGGRIHIVLEHREQKSRADVC